MKKTICIYLVVGISLIVLIDGFGAQNTFPVTQEELSSILQHQENLVRTIECTYESKELPPPPENILILEQIDNLPNATFVTTEEIAQKNSFMKHWWRKGSLEREESFLLSNFDPNNNSAKPATIKAFDGIVVRSLSQNDGETLGTILTIQGAHWETYNFTDPYSFLYEFEIMPYSELIADGRNYRASKQMNNGKEYVHVSVQHPKVDARSFVLIYDEQFRLVERQIIGPSIPNSEPGINERHVFSNYQMHKDNSGEVIWFPDKADYHYYKRLSDGTLVKAKTTQINVKKISFNKPISDDLFTIQFPPGIKIWDGVNNLGLVDKWAELVGESLPELKEFSADLLPSDVNDKMMLVCFFDMEQRPSRNCILELSKKAQELKSKDIEIIVVHASKIEREYLDKWFKENNVNFPVGIIESDEDQIRFNWGVKSLPWLILTDTEHIVTAEGFSINELDERMSTLADN